MKILQFGLAVAVILVLSSFTKDESKSIKPGERWPDDKGVHINAHGGGILIYNNTYYWFGEHKTEGKSGNKANVGVHVYSSKNLSDWKDEGIALAVVKDDKNHDITKGCILERPKVIYNLATKKFVMWFHLELKDQGYSAARTALAVADKVTGPYTYVKSLRPNAGQWPLNFSEEQKQAGYDYEMERWSDKGRQAIKDGMFVKRDFEGGQMCRDMQLFVDENGKGYHIAASEENQTIHIRELTDDYLGFSGNYVRVFPGAANEAPAIFKKDGKYYMFSSGCTGWAPNPGRSGVADNMLGEWTSLGNPFTGPEAEIKTSFNSQPTYVIPVIGKDNAFVYMGDRWNPEDAIDGRYIWLPVEFENNKPIIKWYDQWDLSVFDKSK
jgi:hypothetical protein